MPEFKVYCPKCKKQVALIEKMGGLICAVCCRILFYRAYKEE